jgi:DNA-binding HxlR family transcriptional regulator
MKPRKNKLRSHCPVNYGLEAFGDRWALLILRDIVFRGKRTFGEFLKSEEGFATNILASRLEHLTAEGILQRAEDATDARKALYSLTEKGEDLVPLMFEMVLWSAKHDPKSEAARIPRLVEGIRKDNRKVSRRVIPQVRRGEAIVRDYLS